MAGCSKVVGLVVFPLYHGRDGCGITMQGELALADAEKGDVSNESRQVDGDCSDRRRVRVEMRIRMEGRGGRAGEVGGRFTRVQDQSQWRILDWDAKPSGSSQWQTGSWAPRAE